MEDNKNALDEINKGCTMGIDAINNLIDKVDKKNFKKVLEKQISQYDKIEDKINEIYNNYSSEKTLHEIGPLTKTITDYMTKMKTMRDHTDSKIAEILLQGTNMGIIEGKRIINNKNLNKEIKKLVEEFINNQEMIVESLKEYL